MTLDTAPRTLDTAPRTLSTPPGPRMRFGNGEIHLDATTGAPRQFSHPQNPQRRYLLDESLPWHSSDHQWGSGHVITSTGASRWSAPATLDIESDDQQWSSTATHHLDVGIDLTISRVGSGSLTERYVFTNRTAEPIELTSVGIQTPYADLYENAAEALDRSVHAHIFTGGSWAWALAEPMSGVGPSLGLIVRTGELWGYSVESRNRNTSSNARGHLVLHVTDAARNPSAFGGQPAIRLAPEESYELAWDLAWYADVGSFTTATRAPARFSTLSAAVGTPIRIRSELPVSSPDPRLTIDRDGLDTVVSCGEVGSYSIDLGGQARTEIAFHQPLRETVEARAAYILQHQRPTERAGILANAFVPVDTQNRLTQPANGWSDWSDGSERIGMAVVLQLARNRGWLGRDADDALTAWAEFARRNLVDAEGTPHRGSHDMTGPRLYDSSWLTEFFVARAEHTRDLEDLDLAYRIVCRAFELGASGFLAIGFSENCTALADALDAAGLKDRAGEVRERLIGSARYFLAQGHHLPAHEVAYEQSIVAPLINLFIDAFALTGGAEFHDAIVERLPWLLAFGGPQPHARLNGVAIRHWDGYWFGTRRQWGDIFPHYWSALTSTVLLRLPESIRTARTDALAIAVLRANMSNYNGDGSATCAFVFPTAIDGAPAHAADPLANDQDWHLAMWMKFADQPGVPTA